MTYPFTAIVRQDETKLALLLCAVNPRIGGVVLSGEKGTAKSTVGRGLAELLPSQVMRTLALGATEDRLVGGLDLEATLTSGRPVLQPGLLSEVDGGVLYVDEVNLLDDHLVDLVIDACAGTFRVEREGLTATLASRFVLVGTMNRRKVLCAPSCWTGSDCASRCTASRTRTLAPRSSGVGSTTTPTRVGSHAVGRTTRNARPRPSAGRSASSTRSR